jgi:hypothetical protein
MVSSISASSSTPSPSSSTPVCTAVPPAGHAADGAIGPVRSTTAAAAGWHPYATLATSPSSST